MAVITRFAVLVAVLASALVVADASEKVCNAPDFAECNPDVDYKCCRSGQYCKPLNPAVYRCDVVPAKCSKQLTNIDFYGADIANVQVSYAGQCCDVCANMPGCKAYTFDTSSGNVCYLKSGAGVQTQRAGAVSAMLD